MCGWHGYNSVKATWLDLTFCFWRLYGLGYWRACSCGKLIPSLLLTRSVSTVLARSDFQPISLRCMPPHTCPWARRPAHCKQKQPSDQTYQRHRTIRLIIPTYCRLDHFKIFWDSSIIYSLVLRRTFLLMLTRKMQALGPERIRSLSRWCMDLRSEHCYL